MHEPRLRLVTLHVSPWSERARWALDHHGIAYEKIQHEPFIGEPRLRRIVGPGKKRATVPVLITGDRVLTESWDIAVHADQVGKGSKLIPADREAEVRKWNDLADETMVAARPLVVAGMLASPEALDEGLPPPVPGLLRPLLRPVMRVGTKWFARKYGLRLEDTATPLARLRSTLGTLREALSKGSEYLLGSFSYADIVMATCLQGVSPVADRYLRLRPATRRVWTNDVLATEFADLIAWRDRLYEKHRG
jgi:glutathione S-transferase